MKLIPTLCTELKSNAMERRISNIKFIYNLDRTDLDYYENERQMLFPNFNYDEVLSIQYPGKESVRIPITKYKRENPYDFRPKMLLSSGSYLKDLSFDDIWSCLYDMFYNCRDEHMLKLLACEFYRIAYMIDYNFFDTKDLSLETFDIQNQTKSNYINTTPIYIYKPHPEIIESLKYFSPTILDTSWESFFMYNDLLALNEDCKYYNRRYSDTNDHDIAHEYLRKGTGRVNTMMTHIAIIGVILGEIKLTTLLRKFLYGFGTASLTSKEIMNFLGDYMF